VRIEGQQALELRYDAVNLACTIERVDFVGPGGRKVDLYVIDLTVRSPGAHEQVDVWVEW
jgi:hypothetical protein